MILSTPFTEQMKGILPVYALNTLDYFDGRVWVAGGIFHRVMTGNLTKNMDVDFFTSDLSLVQVAKQFATNEQTRIASIATRHTNHKGMPTMGSSLRSAWENEVRVTTRYDPESSDAAGITPPEVQLVPDYTKPYPLAAARQQSSPFQDLENHVDGQHGRHMLEKHQSRIVWSPKFQVVGGFLFDNCEDTLRSFDLRTSMIGTDGKTLWYNPMALADIKAGHFCVNPEGEQRKYPNPLRLLKHLNHAKSRGSLFENSPVVLGPRVASKLLGTHRSDFSKELLSLTVANGDYD